MMISLLLTWGSVGSPPTYTQRVNVLQQVLEHGRRRLHQTTREFAKFGIIGLINTVVDIGLWNLFNVLAPGAEVKTKIAASLIATASAYVMNRHWAFRHRKRQQLRRETALFLLFNAVGLVIQAGAVAATKYGFDTTDLVLLNVASIIGLGVATMFRFWSYRRWIWRISDPEPSTEDLNKGIGDDEDLPPAQRPALLSV